MKKQLLLIAILALIRLNVNAQTQLITNGNFSSSSGWTTSGNWYITTTKTCFNNSSGYAYAGDANGYALNNETGDLKQTVTIPSTATSATLTFYVSKSTDEVTTTEAFDWVNVFLLNSSGSQLMQFSPTNINNLYAGKPATLCDGYSFKSFSIPSFYFGQPVQVVFRVHSDNAKVTMFRIDDVSLTYISGCSPPSNPANPTSNSPQTGSVTITRVGSPPSGVTWYWQGTSCGTSTSLGSGTTYTATSSGTYYIRAYNNTGGCWSTDCGSVNVSITANCTTPSTPGNPTSNSPQAGIVTITRAGSPPSGVTWYWQGTSCGSSTSLGSGTTYTATVSGTYYIRAYNNTGGCWSPDCGSVSVTISSSSSVSGIDVSHWNGTINWSLVKGAGTVFAFAKCSEGLTGADDDKFTANMINGKNAGVVMGTYHIARPDNRPTSDGAVQEANHFLSLASPFIGTGYLPPALDLEPAYVEGQSKSTLSTWVQAWVTTVQNATGVAPVIYTTHWDANNLLNSSLNIYKLWIANYESNPLTPPTNLGIWSTWAFNQYSETGTVSGISNAVDLNVFNGDMTAFNNLIGSNSTCTDQHESNNTAATASLVFAAPVANSSNLQWQGNIGFVGDDDWYKINIGACGTVTVNLSNLPNDYDIELWDKYSIIAGQGTVLSGSYNTGNSSETVSFSYQGSNIAYIKVYAKNHQNYTTNSCYNIQFIFTPCTGGPPTNDICANATPLTVNSTCMPLTNQFLTNANSEDSPIYCQDSRAEIGYDVWYKFIATGTNQTIDFNNNGSFDAFISLYRDCPDNNQSSFQISCDNKQGAITIPASGLTVGKPYFIRIHDFYGYAQNKPFSICVTGSSLPQTPTITASQTSLPDFGNVQVSTYSSPQNYTVSGSNLTANITLSAPSGFQISTSSSSGFGNTLTLTQSGGTVSSTTIYVRFSPSSIGIQSGNISITSSGATTKNVSVSGTGTSVPTPIITASTTSLPDFGNVLVSTNTSSQNFTVSGSSLTANITISAPNGFQISTSSSSSFGNTLTLTQSGGTVSNTPIYVRFSPSSIGIQSGNISLTSTGATTKYVSVSGTGSQTCTPPTSQASAITFSGVGTNSMTANWTNGNGSRRVVKINTSNSFTALGNGTDPTANSSYSGSGEQVVYNGSSNNVTVTELSAGITYWFRVYEANCPGSSSLYYTVTASNNPNSQVTTSSCIAPNNGIISPSNPTVTVSNSINLTVTANGTAPFTYQWYWWNGSDWTTLTNSSPYSGVTAQTLSINSTTTSMNGYFYTCLVSNTCGSQNNISYVQLAVNSSCTVPTTQASAITFSGLSTNSMTANWTNGNGSRRVVKINTSNSFTAPGTGIDPTANSSYSGSGEQVVYNGTGTSATVTGLSAGITYWFRVYEANCTGSSSLYSTVTASNNPNSQITSSSCIAPNNGIISPSNPTVTATNSINLTVTANGTAPFTYQWYWWNGSDWTALTNSSPYSGVTTQTLSINSTTTSMNGYYYTCLVSNTCGSQNNISYVQLAVSSSCTTPNAPATCTSSIGDPANGLIHTLNLSCDMVPGADGYFFEYSVDGITWNTNWGSLTTNDISINIQDQPNVTRYYRVRAYKCDPVIYSQYTYASPQPIYSACDEPATPTVNGATASSLNITLNTEAPVANPSITTYSIYCSTTNQYVQANGTLGSSEVFQTKSSWGTKTITGLLSNKDYCFYAKAKNNDGDIRYNTQNEACAKTSNSPPAVVLATITTSATTAISISTASGGGNVTADGGAPVTVRGVCWSTTTNPTTNDSKTSDGTGIGSFTSSITGLTADIKYHVRAYAINSAGTAYGPDVSFTTYPKPPTIASISQPTCTLSTGSVALTDLSANGSWIITQNPGGKTFSGSETSKTITGLAAGVYSFTVTNSAGNTSDPSLSATINSPFATPLIPIVGTITQPTCSVSTGSVVLNGLPYTGTWILNPGSITGSGTSKTLTGLASGKYNFNVTNASGCVSASTGDIVINSPSTAPATPTIGTITQPTCSVSTGSVVLNGLPSTGTWVLNPGAISGSGTSKTLTGIASGTYNFSVTNAAGCASSNSTGVVIDPQPTLPSIGTISGTTTVCQGQNAVSYTVSTIANATSYVWILPSGTSGSSTTNSINVNFGTSAVSGNITVKGHNDCGDGTVSSLSIAVNQLPMNAGSISGSSNVCQGLSSVTYSVPIINNATSYIWSLPSGASGSSTTNSIIVNYGTSAVSGNIKVKGHNACGDGVESALVVNVYPVPVAPVISINSGILQSNSSSGNQWVLDNNIIKNAVNYQYTPSQAGNYYVIVTLNGCASPMSNTIAYIPTGIEEVVENKGISMYPNPTTGLVKILINDKMDSNYSVDVYNSNGSLLRELKKDRSVSDFDVDLSQYPAGIYIISIKSTGIFYKNKVAKRN